LIVIRCIAQLILQLAQEKQKRGMQVEPDRFLKVRDGRFGPAQRDQRPA